MGNRESVSYPSGNVTLYDYDAQNQLTRLTTTDAADQVVADYAYTLDATGRRTQVQERPTAAAPPATATTRCTA